MELATVLAGAESQCACARLGQRRCRRRRSDDGRQQQRRAGGHVDGRSVAELDGLAAIHGPRDAERASGQLDDVGQSAEGAGLVALLVAQLRHHHHAFGNHGAAGHGVEAGHGQCRSALLGKCAADAEAVAANGQVGSRGCHGHRCRAQHFGHVHGLGLGALVKHHGVAGHKAGLVALGIHKVERGVEVPVGALVAHPVDGGGVAQCLDVHIELALFEHKRHLVAVLAVDGQIVDRAHQRAHFGNQVAAAGYSRLAGSGMQTEAYDGAVVGQDASGRVERVDGELLYLEHVGLGVFRVEVDLDARAEVELERVDSGRAGSVGTAGRQNGTVVERHAASERALGVEACEAVEVHGAGRHPAVEAERACPHLGVAGVGLVDGGQHKGAVALLYQTHLAAEACAGGGVGEVGARDVVIVVVALHVRRRVDRQYVRLGAACHAECGVGGGGEEDVLAVVCRRYFGAGLNLGAPVADDGRRSHGYLLKLAQEVADVRRLVVAVHLGNHGVAILMVVEQRVVAPCGGGGGGVDADVAGRGAHHHLLAPVAEDVGLKARRGLGRVVGERAGEGGDGCRAAVFVDAACALRHSGTVERFLLQVAVPVDAEVLGDAGGHKAVEVVVGDAADGRVVGR